MYLCAYHTLFRNGIDADLWNIMGACMMDALSAVCEQHAGPNFWNDQEKLLWSDYIRTTFDLGAQRAQRMKDSTKPAGCFTFTMCLFLLYLIFVFL